MKSRSIPKKNYIILFLIVLATFLVVYYLYRWYTVYSEYQNDIPVIRDTLLEVSEEEMHHYIQENDLAVIYLCTADDIDCRNFEKSFIKLINKKSLKDDIIYVNLTDIDKTEFLDNFNNRYSSKKKLKNYPSLISFESGTISDILQEGKEKLSIRDVESFIKRNEIGITE